MKISQLLTEKKITISFEIFPPKADTPFKPVIDAAKKLAFLNPDFMSVTYGANGGASQNTVSIASTVQNAFSTTAMAHLTCVSSDEARIERVLNGFRDEGIENVLALRGDKPQGYDGVSNGHYEYAYQLVKHIKDRGDFSVGGACYPEGHIESENRDKDIDNLKIKVDSGCDFLITQMFFDNEIFYGFLDKAKQKGINIPVIPGIMPAMTAKQIKKSCEISGTKIPEKFRKLMEKYGDDNESFLNAGIGYAVEQISELIKFGVPGIHLYTMNKPDVALKILDGIRELIK